MPETDVRPTHHGFIAGGETFFSFITGVRTSLFSVQIYIFLLIIQIPVSLLMQPFLHIRVLQGQRVAFSLFLM